MKRAAGRHAAGGRAEGRLPRRPAAGAEQARADLKYREARRAPVSSDCGWETDPATLRRVRDALAPGRQP
jgi:hypothetical protein